MNRFGLLLVLLFLLSAVNAGATQQGQSALRSFKIMDACAKQAQTAFPDFNADSFSRQSSLPSPPPLAAGSALAGRRFCPSDRELRRPARAAYRVRYPGWR